MDKNLLTKFQTIKGFFYVLLTGFLLFLLVRRHMQRLRDANEKALESDKLKSSFLSNISHEIRTPMNGILGFSRLLSEPNLSTEEQKEYIGLIEQSGERMLYLLNNIVEISKIESGVVKCKFSRISLIELFDALQMKYNDLALRSNNELSHLIENDKKISSDFEKLYSIMGNLINNAIKYTKNGQISFGYQEKRDFLEFFVKDSGIGIPNDRQKAIFERFIQSDLDDKNALQGAGLGLSISAAYVKLLHGEIWVESQENIGSIFKFTIPNN